MNPIEMTEKRVMLERAKCRQDLFYLCRDMLGMRDLAKLHWKLCRWYESVRDEKRRRLVMLPRGNLKSSIITIGGTIQAILRTHGQDSDQTEACTAIGSWDRRAAEINLLGTIRRHFERNERLKVCFPDIFWENPIKDCTGQRITWGQERITVKRVHSRTDDRPTILAFSCEEPPTSFHFHRLVIDDMVTEKSVTTPEIIRKVFDKSALIEYLLVSPDDEIDWIGTHYARGDLYVSMLDFAKMQEERGDEPELCVFKRPAIIDGKPIWPKRFPLKKLNQMREKNPRMFACQQMLDPNFGSLDAVDVTKIRFMNKKDFPSRRELYVVLTVDPAVSTKPHADYTAATVWGFDSRDNRYLLGGLRRRMGPMQFGPQIANLERRWRPDVVAVEDFGFQTYCLHALRENGVDQAHGYRGKGKKEDRIRGILPFIARGKVVLPKEPILQLDESNAQYNLVDVFIQELTQFPYGKHDDFLDATAAAFMFRGEPSYEINELRPEDCVTLQDKANYHWQMLERSGGKVPRGFQREAYEGLFGKHAN